MRVPRPGPHPVDYAIALVLLGVLLGWCVWGEETHARRTQARKEQLDLPITPPKLGQPMTGFYPTRDGEGSTPPPTEPPGDDPRDTPPPVFYGEEIECESDSLIYVLDRSGSMGWGSKPSPWERVRAETIRSVCGLSNNFRFDVVTFGSAVLARFGELVEADDANKAKATVWLEAQYPSGGTPTASACAFSLAEDRSNMTLILLSDGVPNGGTGPTRKAIKSANAQGAVINCFGVNARGEFRAFLQGVAADSGGQYADVP